MDAEDGAGEDFAELVNLFGSFFLSYSFWAAAEMSFYAHILQE